MSQSRQILFRFSNFLNQIEKGIRSFFGHGGYPGLCIAGVEIQSLHNLDSYPKSKYSLKDLIGDGFLWAVPKHRRTVERRLKRKYGHTDYIMKIILPKNNLRVCNHCGHEHEIGVLCPHCYKKIRTETEQMQEKIQEKLGLDPVEQEVVVLYESENNEQSSEFYKGKRIVEMKKPRPMWFSKNLLQKSTQQPARSKNVKPNDLG